MSNYISRRDYADTFGPTVGDRIRLADTELFIEVEQDLYHLRRHLLRRRGKVWRRQGDS